MTERPRRGDRSERRRCGCAPRFDRLALLRRALEVVALAVSIWTALQTV